MSTSQSGKSNQEFTFRRGISGIWLFLGVILLIILAMSIFFVVTDITVDGNARYTDEEIIAASGLETGENLFFIDRYEAASRIFAELPYVNDAVVARELPNRVRITITESSAMAYVAAEGKNWVLDQNCKILRSAEAGELNSLIRVDGVVPLEPKEGTVMAVDEQSGAQLRYLIAILNQILTRGMWTDVAVIDLNDVTSPAFTYQERFTVRLGENEDLDYKFGLLQSAIQQLTESDAGTLDLSMDQQVHFSPG